MDLAGSGPRGVVDGVERDFSLESLRPRRARRSSSDGARLWRLYADVWADARSVAHARLEATRRPSESYLARSDSMDRALSARRRVVRQDRTDRDYAGSSGADYGRIESDRPLRGSLPT